MQVGEQSSRGRMRRIRMGSGMIGRRRERMRTEAMQGGRAAGGGGGGWE